MKKIVKKYGSSVVIIFSAEDLKIYGIKVGDIIDIEDIVVVSNKNKGNSNVVKEKTKNK